MTVSCNIPSRSIWWKTNLRQPSVMGVSLDLERFTAPRKERSCARRGRWQQMFPSFANFCGRTSRTRTQPTFVCAGVVVACMVRCPTTSLQVTTCRSTPLTPEFEDKAPRIRRHTRTTWCSPYTTPSVSTRGPSSRCPRPACPWWRRLVPSSRSRQRQASQTSPLWPRPRPQERKQGQARREKLLSGSALGPILVAAAPVPARRLYVPASPKIVQPSSITMIPLMHQSFRC